MDERPNSASPAWAPRDVGSSSPSLVATSTRQIMNPPGSARKLALRPPEINRTSDPRNADNRGIMIGKTIKGYLIHERIKEGSVGTVWRVTNSRQEVFALKQMSAANAVDGDKVKQFEKEASITQKLAHKGFVK